MTGKFFSKISGVTHANPDGTNRQALIRRYCRPGLTLTLRRDLNNEFDRHAVEIWLDDHWLGYATRESAKSIANHLDAGLHASATITQLTGDTKTNPTLGVNIEVILHDSTTPQPLGVSQPAAAIEPPSPADRPFNPPLLKIVFIASIVIIILAYIFIR